MDVTIRLDLYPRFEPDKEVIERYTDVVDSLPPIILNQNLVLVDGYHRWQAHKQAGKTTIRRKLFIQNQMVIFYNMPSNLIRAMDSS